MVQDFNHIISNLGYVVLGLGLSCRLVRRWLNRMLLHKNEPIDLTEHGVSPAADDAVLLMALAVTCEGLTSSV